MGECEEKGNIALSGAMMDVGAYVAMVEAASTLIPNERTRLAPAWARTH
jgi:hypothetical protein